MRGVFFSVCPGLLAEEWENVKQWKLKRMTDRYVQRQTQREREGGGGPSSSPPLLPLSSQVEQVYSHTHPPLTDDDYEPALRRPLRNHALHRPPLPGHGRGRGQPAYHRTRAHVPAGGGGRAPADVLLHPGGPTHGHVARAGHAEEASLYH